MAALLTNVVVFNVVDLDHVMDLLMCNKKELSNEDLIGLKTVGKKQGRRIQKRLKLGVS